MTVMATERPFDLPYMVEQWDDADSRVEELIALTGDFQTRLLADSLDYSMSKKRRESLAPRPSSPPVVVQSFSLSSARESQAEQIRQAWQISGEGTRAPQIKVQR